LHCLGICLLPDVFVSLVIVLKELADRKDNNTWMGYKTHHMVVLKLYQRPDVGIVAILSRS
jgi:hypothetical protein